MGYERVFMEINLGAIASNVRIIRSHVKKGVKIMAVVKADGYGHGAYETAKTALANGAEQLGVAICEEGVMLREAGLDSPILILGYNPEPKMRDALKYNLTQTIFSYKTAKELSEIAASQNQTAQIHIKADTGMNRIGFRPEEEAEIIKISKLPNIKITGIYSHFASSDAMDKGFAHKQYSLFMRMTENLNKNGIDVGLRHISNSGAILDLKDFECDMVRAGIIMYGYAPSDKVRFDIGLKPAMNLKTHVSHVKRVSAGESVGYGQNFFAEKEMTIATAPVGYADGYSRLLSNKGGVLVRGKYARIIGNICMDQFMMDVTHIEGVELDDEIALIGKQGDREITVEEIAAIQNTINYEIICCIGKRVPRVYIRG